MIVYKLYAFVGIRIWRIIVAMYGTNNIKIVANVAKIDIPYTITTVTVIF
jgi:hypothetical protein